jgi:SAM-dependent methyltransferase
MNSFVYWLMYRLGLSRWDSGKVPPEVVQAFQAGNIPDGSALDLGCGTGTNVIFMAASGRQVIGIDFVPQAIAKAQAKARQAGVADRTQFIRADVTRLKELKLPQCAFALDMGCFHGLNPVGQLKYAQGLADLVIPTGRFMLYAMEPSKETGMTFGVGIDRVKAVFSPSFEILHVEPGDFRGRKSAWYWMGRKPG